LTQHTVQSMPSNLYTAQSVPSTLHTPKFMHPRVQVVHKIFCAVHALPAWSLASIFGHTMVLASTQGTSRSVAFTFLFVSLIHWNVMQ
jgi:hypothetical protein